MCVRLVESCCRNFRKRGVGGARSYMVKRADSEQRRQVRILDPVNSKERDSKLVLDGQQTDAHIQDDLLNDQVQSERRAR